MLWNSSASTTERVNGIEKITARDTAGHGTDLKPESKGTAYTASQKVSEPWTTADGSPRRDAAERPNVEWSSSLNATDWKHYTDPRTVIPTLLLTSTILLSVKLHHSYLRRIPEATHIAPKWFRKRSLFGTVTRVGDADNFHLFHTPGGRLAGWGWPTWLGRRQVPTKAKDLKGKTIHIRLAGVDAPELSHFGKPAQPYSNEAHAWLTNYLMNRRVRAYVYKRDQYERVVATVWVRRFLFRQDVGKAMLKAGWATVYEAKGGAEFGAFEDEYRKIEAQAKKKKIGMWAGTQKDYESPRDYKTRTANLSATTPQPKPK